MPFKNMQALNMHLKQRMLTVEVWFFCFYVALKMQYVTKKEKVRQPPPVN